MPETKKLTAAGKAKVLALPAKLVTYFIDFPCPAIPFGTLASEMLKPQLDKVYLHNPLCYQAPDSSCCRYWAFFP